MGAINGASSYSLTYDDKQRDQGGSNTKLIIGLP